MKTTTQKRRTKSTPVAKKSAKKAGAGRIMAAVGLGKQDRCKQPEWVRLEAKGFMDALSGR